MKLVITCLSPRMNLNELQYTILGTIFMTGPGIILGSSPVKDSEEPQIAPSNQNREHATTVIVSTLETLENQSSHGRGTWHHRNKKQTKRWCRCHRLLPTRPTAEPVQEPRWGQPGRCAM